MQFSFNSFTIKERKTKTAAQKIIHTTNQKLTPQFNTYRKSKADLSSYCYTLAEKNAPCVLEISASHIPKCLPLLSRVASYYVFVM